MSTKGGAPFETSKPFDAHIGPLMFGAHGSMVLTGVIWCQTVAYFNRFQNKREPATKALIAGLALLFTIKLTVDSLWMYEYFVYNFGNGAVFGSSPPTFQIGAWLSTVPAILCQIWLLLRVYVVSQRKVWLLCALAVPVTATSLAGIMATFYKFRYHFQSGTPPALVVWTPLWLYSTCATNCLLTVSFVICITRYKPQTSHPRLRQLLRQLVSVAIQACLPTTLATVMVAILSRVSPDTLASVPFLFLVAPLYFMSVLYTLNSREKPVEDLSQDYTTRSLQCAMPSARSRLANSFLGQETARSTTLCNPEFAVVRMDSDLSDDNVEKLAERDGTLRLPL